MPLKAEALGIYSFECIDFHLFLSVFNLHFEPDLVHIEPDLDHTLNISKASLNEVLTRCLAWP